MNDSEGLDPATGNRERRRRGPIKVTVRSIRDTDWFRANHFSPAFYLFGVFAMPLAVVLAFLQPFSAPDVVYGVIFGGTGIPAWLLSEEWAEPYKLGYYSWTKVKVQLWLQVGGAVPMALRELIGNRRI